MSDLFDLDRIRQAMADGTGRGVKVAVLDTGVEEDHEELRGKVTASYEVERRGRRYECVARKGTDAVGHGTACAAIIKEIAPEAEIHSLKVIGANARGTCAELTQGLKWSVVNDMDVVNASLGTIDLRDPGEIADVADAALYKGVTVIAAANNSGRESYPANLSSVIAVDFEKLENMLDFRYRPNNEIEIEANGIMIEAPNPRGGRKFYTGTSFACPHVSGIVARLLSAFPDLQPFEVRALLWHIGRID